MKINDNNVAGFATVDLSNILIEGQRLAAVRSGLAVNIKEAKIKRILDPRWRISARRLYDFLSGGQRLKDALVVGSHPQGQPPGFATPFRAAGFRTALRARNLRGKEKGVDLSVLSVIFSIAERGDPGADDVTHLGGDGDHLPLLEQLTQRGFRVDIIGWLHSTSRDLILASSRFIPLDPYFDHIGFYQNRAT